MVRNSPLAGCVVSSIRQNSNKKDDDWPARVALNAIRGVVGAAFQSTGHDIDRMCPVIDALSTHLDCEINRNESSTSRPTPPSSLKDPIRDHGTATPRSVTDYTEHFMDIDERNTILGINLSQMPSLSRSEAIPPSNEINTAFQTDMEGMPSALEGLSLAHTSVEGQQCFNLVESRPIGDVRPKIRSKPPHASPTGDVPPNVHDKPPPTKKTTKTRTRKMAMEEYVSQQRLLTKHTPLTASGNNRSYLDTDAGLQFKDKPQKTILKIYHGLVSSYAVLHVRNALLSRQSAHSARESSAHASPSVFHYHMIKQYDSSNAVDTMRRLHHIYLLYTTLRSPWQVEMDDGFTEEESINFSSGSAKRKRPVGNPLVRHTSDAFEDLLRAVVPDLQQKNPDEQERLTADVHRLQAIGSRLFVLVEEYGVGILGLLYFHQSIGEAQQLFTITDSE